MCDSCAQVSAQDIHILTIVAIVTPQGIMYVPWSALTGVMALCETCTKPLPESILTWYKLDPQEHTSVKLLLVCKY